MADTVRTLRAKLEAEDDASPVFSKVAGSLSTLGAIAAAVGLVEIGRKLVARYRGLVTDVEFSIPAATEAERGVLRELLQDIRADQPR